MLVGRNDPAHTNVVLKDAGWSEAGARPDMLEKRMTFKVSNAD